MRKTLWAAMALLVQPAHAANDTGNDVLACAEVRANSERLACYDRLATRLQAARTPATKNGEGPATATAGSPALTPAPTAAPLPAPEVTPPAKEVFGLRTPPQRPVTPPVERASLDSITARVTSIHPNAHGGIMLELDNGQSWDQLGTADLSLDVGDTVKISRALLGSFWLSTPHNRGSKVTRLR